MAKFVLSDSDVSEIIDTIVSLKRNSLPSGNCPYAMFDNGHKCIEQGCDVHQRMFWQNYEKKWQDFFNERKDNEGGKRIYVMTATLFDEKHIQDMTDEEIKELCAKDKDADNHDIYDSVEELSANWNTDEIFSPFNSYMRIIND